MPTVSAGEIIGRPAVGFAAWMSRIKAAVTNPTIRVAAIFKSTTSTVV
jgi:hypothetical protein